MLVSALGLALAPGHEVSAQEPPSQLRAHAATLDADLARMQRDTRIYFAGWTATNSSLASAQIAIALTTDSVTVRNNYFVGAGLSAAGLLVLLAQPWPGLRAHTRYRAMPDGSPSELAAKVRLGESLLARQMHRDALAVSTFKHVIAATVAFGAGIRAGISFDSWAQGVGRTLFVLFVLEGQILTSPGQYFRPRSDRSAAQLTWTPWLERHLQGIQLGARF
ncbi:MAG TPA: hypothetical protein VFX59_02550 [Polyangiales bacterium]|nr:hypothetical protein [Polyangiales bacterium]